MKKILLTIAVYTLMVEPALVGFLQLTKLQAQEKFSEIRIEHTTFK